jgi:hypothetical protein
MCSTSYSERGRRSSFQTTTASPSRSAPAYGAARVGPNRQGEIRDRTFENQSSRASGLSLIAAAIVHWNPVRGLAIPYPFSRQRWYQAAAVCSTPSASLACVHQSRGTVCRVLICSFNYSITQWVTALGIPSPEGSPQ